MEISVWETVMVVSADGHRGPRLHRLAQVVWVKDRIALVSRVSPSLTTTETRIEMAPRQRKGALGSCGRRRRGGGGRQPHLGALRRDSSRPGTWCPLVELSADVFWRWVQSTCGERESQQGWCPLAAPKVLRWRLDGLDELVFN